MSEFVVPVLTIDGPSGSGKGVTSSLVAQNLNWHLLDSGSIYRAIAWLVDSVPNTSDLLGNEQALSEFVQADTKNFFFKNSQILYNQKDITAQIRTDKISLLTSKIAALNGIRQAVLSLQRSFAQKPGLVADGRDMGSVVFPDAQYKIFLTTNAQVRAQRRYQQLNESDPTVIYEEVYQALIQRDQQDENRTISPLKVPAGATVIDNSNLSIKQVVTQIINIVKPTTIKTYT
jgi:cytidylate kinase